jgi:hypothetical protein
MIMQMLGPTYNHPNSLNIITFGSDHISNVVMISKIALMTIQMMLLSELLNHIQ